MKVKITNGTILNGKDLFADNIYDLDEADAKALITKGRAVEVKETTQEDKTFEKKKK